MNVSHRDCAIKKTAVTGARGQLGFALGQLLGDAAWPLSADTMDLRNPRQIRDVLQSCRPRVVINCGAYTAVDAAETDTSQCFAINSEAVKTLVEVTTSLDCSLVQISTDYVFGAEVGPGRPYCETDPVAPQGVYARSKAAAEQSVRQHPQHLIIRTCGLYGPSLSRGGSNFVNTMLRLGKERPSVRVVDDQTCCPTYVAELAPAILHLIQTRNWGTYHVVNRQALSWCELAHEIFRLARLPCEVIPISSEEFGALAPRPRYSALDVSKYVATAGPPLSTCREALAQYLATLSPAATTP